MAANKSRNDSTADKSLNRSHASLQRVRSARSRKFSHKYDMIKNNTHLHGWISHVEDPFNFYVRFNDWNTQQFTYLMTELQEEAPSFSAVQNPQQGAPYVAHYCGQWFRVLLESILSETKAMVFFVDIGDRQTLNLSDLREIDERFLCLPVQASLCQLGCITVSKHNPKQTSWPSESSTYIKQLMLPEHYVNIFVVGCYVGEVGRLHKKESKLYVTVYVGEDEKSVNSKLSEAGHGHSVQKHEEPWHKAMRVAPQPADRIYGITSIASCTQVTTKTVVRRESLPASIGNGSSRNIPPMCIEVSVSHIIDPGKFFIRHHPKEYHSQQQILNDMGPGLQKARSIQVGHLYAVLDTQSMQWYRGNCLRQADSTSNEVLYDFHLIDEGRALQIPSHYVHHLSEELKSSRPMVWECSLYMKKPKSGWPRSAVDLFKKLVHRDKLKMTIFSAQEGIRRVDLAQIPLYNGEPAVESVKDAVTSAIQAEKLAIGHPPPPAVPPKPVARKYFSSLTGVKKGSSLHGQVTHVYNPDSFYIRFDESDAQKFPMFDAQMQAEYNTPGARSLYEVGVPQKGFPYVLLHDDHWYRILVEDVAGEEEYSAFFVDTGLRQTAKPCDMLQILDRFIAYPVQVTLCKLYGVCTKVPSGIWSVESKFHFKQMVSEARVTAYVEGSAAGGIGKTSEEETLFSVVLYKGNDSSSLNTRFTRAGYAISVRQHDLPTHNRPKEDTDHSEAESADSICSSNQTLTSSRCCDNPSPRSSQSCMDRSGVQIRLITPQECVYDMSADEVSPVGPPPKTAQNQGKPRKISLGADSCLSDMSCTSGSNFAGSSPDHKRPFCSSAVSYGDLSNMDADGSKSDDADGHLKSASPSPSLSDEVSALESVKISGTMPQEGDYVVSVKFLMCESPEAIYVRPLPYEARFEQLNADMQHAYRTIRVQQIRSVCAGTYCAAFVYGQWVRAVVVNCLDNLHCLITCMDTGQPHQVTVEQIFPLIKPFCFETIPKMALKCSLSGISPANGTWDSDLVPKITFALLGADEVFISCKRPKTIPDTMVVRIVYGKAHANGKTLVNLNDQLLQGKLGHSNLVPFNNNNTNCSNLSSRCCPER